jgi:glycosyltransferase involved in cell wall biosynthesis
VTEPDPLVSVVITTRDRHERVRHAIGSALAQTASVEVIVVDDASTPPVSLSDVDPRVKLISLQSHSGVCAARNAGLAKATGDWVWFLDDDDELARDAVSVSLRAARESLLPRPLAVLSGMRLVDPKGNAMETRYPPTLSAGRRYFLEDGVTGSFQLHATLMAPTQVLRSIGGWNESLRAWEHDDLFLRLNALCSLQGVNTVTYTAHLHDDTHVSDGMIDRAEAMQATLVAHQPLFVQAPRKHARYLGVLAMTYLRAGKWKPSLRAAFESFRTDPLRDRALPQLLIALAGPRAWRVLRSRR